MTHKVEASYSGGVLKPTRELPLRELLVGEGC